jgi:hypothetical protein
VTVNEQLAVLFATSVAVHVTVVVPSAKVDPDGGTHATTKPHGSVTVGGGYVTAAANEHPFVRVPVVVTFGGHTMEIVHA